MLYLQHPTGSQEHGCPTLQMEAPILRSHHFSRADLHPDLEDFIPVGYCVKISHPLGTVSNIISWG